MKVLTKEWVNDIEFHELIMALEPNSKMKMPFVFTNGGTDCVANKHLHTVKSNFNLTDKENEIQFILLPATLEFDLACYDDEETTGDKCYKNYFLKQYMHRLRAISNIPDNILTNVKDKRLLALGYADKQTKKQILDYIKPKFRKAVDLDEECCAATVKAEEGLTIHEQLKREYEDNKLPIIFDLTEITKFEKDKDKIYLRLEDTDTIVFSGAEIMQQEADIVNSIVYGIELYKNENRYELHFLILKRDENCIPNYYYVTYTFEDLKFVK